MRPAIGPILGPVGPGRCPRAPFIIVTDGSQGAGNRRAASLRRRELGLRGERARARQRGGGSAVAADALGVSAAGLLRLSRWTNSAHYIDDRSELLSAGRIASPESCSVAPSRCRADRGPEAARSTPTIASSAILRRSWRVGAPQGSGPAVLHESVGRRLWRAMKPQRGAATVVQARTAKNLHRCGLHLHSRDFDAAQRAMGPLSIVPQVTERTADADWGDSHVQGVERRNPPEFPRSRPNEHRCPCGNALFADDSARANRSGQTVS
jgi:hypothetical protein